ncbi:MAG TPA: carboxypeptidase-like regulatory domain-containing protein [Burkholderiales bacterium]|nr:carboxypeptidase-like regulatory domain-containing protein [Burkholderiales bacterium]
MNLKVLLLGAAAAMALATVGCQTQPQIAAAPVTEGDDIVGVVTGDKGPEAGVWVIAETLDLPTKYTKIVVTDDQGRYAIPDLPKASYDVWVRGYGLVDSAKVKAQPGATLNLRAGRAASAKEAAEIYPAMYWFSLLHVPAASEFPLGPVSSQQQWLNTIKEGACQSCHALGTPGTRHVPDLFMQMGKGDSREAWRNRLRAGSAQALMARDISRLDGERAIANFADWTDRIAKGELPFDQPRRPEGLERNLVITMWDYSAPQFYLHDVVSTDRRNPRVNPNGAVYASPEDSTDIVAVVDPRTNRAIDLPHPLRDPATPSVKSLPYGVSAYWGDKPYWEGHTLNHNPMMDERVRTWFTSRITPDANPDWCKSGSSLPSAQAFPLNGGANRHLGMFDPYTNQWTLIRTCFPTHHLNFDNNGVLWLSPGVVGPGVMGWLDTKKYEQTKDERASQGWTPLIVDTNGDGKRGDYVAHDQPLDPTRDKQVMLNLYAIAPNLTDGSVWGTAIGYPGQIVRFVPGPDPIHTGLTEVYEPPLPGYGPRGGDVDSKGVYWVALSSGHLGEFDRRKCKVLNGPTALGKHCPEGWTLHPFPGPQLRDVKDPGSAEISYYVWVDRYNVLGLGADVPIAMGNGSDSIMPFVDGKFVTLRLPYPSGVFPKNVDGRIDDDAAGWKGRALWTTSGTRVNFHLEGGKSNRPKAIKLQLRPDPLAH